MNETVKSLGCGRHIVYTRRLLLILSLIAYSHSYAFRMESGTVTIAATPGATTPPTFNFQNAFDVTPLLFVMTTDSEGDPAYVRVVNVTTTQFSLALVEAGDDAFANTLGVAAMDVDYFAIEPGVHYLPDGNRIAAGTVDTAQIQHGANVGGGEGVENNVSLGFAFATTAALLVEIQTTHSEPGIQSGTESAPWLTPQVYDVSNGTADFALQRSEVDDPNNSPPDNDSDDVVTETIAFVAMQDVASGSFNDISSNTIFYESRITPDSITGWGSCPSATVNFTTLTDPNIKVIASKNRLDGGDGGWLRRCDLSNNSASFIIDEDRDNDSERNHTTESAGVFAFSNSFHADLPDVSSSPDPNFMLEVNTATAASNGLFTSVNFQQVYPEPPAVFVFNDLTNTEPAAVRIRNVTDSGFELAVVEPITNNVSFDDTSSPETTISYMAIEQGLHQLPDGNAIEVNTVDIDDYQARDEIAGVARSWQTISLALSSFSNTPELPIVLAQIQTINNGGSANMPSEPWLTAAIQNVSENGFQVALERAEVNTGTPLGSTETIAYLVMNSNVNNSGNEFIDINGDPITYETVLMHDNVLGVDDGTCRSEPLTVFTEAPLVVASQTRRDGNNGGWARLCAVSSSAVAMAIDEDTYRDNERSHTTESVSVLAFSSRFAADFSARAYYRMDEFSWINPGDVKNLAAGNLSPSVLDGDPINGLVSEQVNPAIVGNPGTCGYGRFDRDLAQYINVPHNSALDIEDELTVTAWFNTDTLLLSGSDLRTIYSKDEHTEFHARRLRGIFWWYGGGVRQIITNQQYSLGTWNHIAVVYSQSQARQTVYLNGVADSNITSLSTPLILNTDPLQIGADIGRTDRNFDGFIDEVRVYNSAKTAAQVNDIMNRVQPCEVPPYDHYSIVHSGNAVSCLSETVEIIAHDATHTPIDPGNATLSLSTSTGKGDWVKMIGSQGTGTLTNLGNGNAIYEFPGGESSVQLSLYYTDLGLNDSETLSINVTDGTITETSGVATKLLDDPDLTFSKTGFRFFNQADASTVIPTQIAGKASNIDIGSHITELYLQAIRTSDEDPAQCVAAFPAGETRDIELWGACINPAACAGMTIAINGSDISTQDTPASPPNPIEAYSLLFEADPTNTFTQAELVFEYHDAGLMQLHSRYEIPIEDGSGSATGSGHYMQGSSNQFVVRPFAFSVEVPTASPQHADSAAGDVFVEAGSLFPVTIRPVIWDSGYDVIGSADGQPDGHDDDDPSTTVDLSSLDTTPNFGNENIPEVINLLALLDQPMGGDDPGLSGTTNTASYTNGEATINNVVYNEVGIIEISAGLNDFDYLGAGNINGKSSYVGRFYPDRLRVEINNMPALGNSCTAGGTDFTYMDQPFYYVTAPTLAVSAVTEDGILLENYDVDTGDPNTDFYKLTIDDLERTFFDNVMNSTSLSVSRDSDIAIINPGDFDGIFTYRLDSDADGDEFTYLRGSALENEFSADIDVIFEAQDDTFPLTSTTDLTDSDGVCYDADNDEDCDEDDDLRLTLNTETQLRLGRLVTSNVSGSELLPLNMPLVTQYFNGDVFIDNSDDLCTNVLVTPHFILSNNLDTGKRDGIITVGSATTTTSLLNSPFISGLNGLVFSPPGAGNTGYIDVEIDLSDTADGASLPWLQFDWDNDGLFDDNPTGRGTFGIYNQPAELIYIREPWN